MGTVRVTYVFNGNEEKKIVLDVEDMFTSDLERSLVQFIVNQEKGEWTPLFVPDIVPSGEYQTFPSARDLARKFNITYLVYQEGDSAEVLLIRE